MFKNIVLPKQKLEHQGRKTLVLDLDETLIHSENIPPPNKSQVKAFKI